MIDSTRRCRIVLFSAILAAGLVADTPEILAAENITGRYQMQKTDDGILRLDTQTGQISLCSDAGGRWSCESIESGRQGSADGDRVAQLERENAQLKEDVKRLEDMIGLGKTKPKRHTEQFSLPSEEDVDRAMTMFEKMLRRFKDALKDLEKDDPEKKGTPL